MSLKALAIDVMGEIGNLYEAESSHLKMMAHGNLFTCTFWD